MKNTRGKIAPGICVNKLRTLRSRVAKLRYLIDHQRKWIEWCEGGVSYDGENGMSIRKADADELHCLETEMKMRTGKPKPQ